ncbi:DUF6359 domain-containing protein [uncultured Bacteroides sp.]|uniref:DUF6359 domain-containing protein n=1 Tax=uncultured Bacteroides sp. TaxID=162156 RepID=UPI0026766FA2|nr:DUF6359 domain-containing protein [uncultured Bacteroides sp.]
MKKILNALFLTLFAVFTFSSCSDVPAPYEILEEGDVPGLVGDGTKENPYNIEAAQQKQDGSIAWVQGYIVGAMENVYDDEGEFAGNKASFTAPFNVTSNVLIAESPDETTESKCLPVKIKNGSDLSNALNLKDHPENKGGVLLIQGELSSGFGKAALINTTAAVFNNKEIGEEQGGDKPSETVIVTKDNPYTEDFSAEPFSFTIENKEIGGLSWVWSMSTTYKNASASAYKDGQNYAAESWLMSPILDLSALTSAKLTFTQTSYTEGKDNEFMLKIKDKDAADWTAVTIEMPLGNSHADKSTVTVDLKDYVGKSIQFAFIYDNDNTTSANTWRISDVKVESDESAVIPPVEGQIFAETFGTPVEEYTNVSEYLKWDNPECQFNVSHEGVNIRAIAHKTEDNKTETAKINSIWFSKGYENWFSISGINTAGYNRFKVVYEVAANIYSVGETADLNALKVSLNDVEVQAESKVVTATVAKDDANIFYTMSVEIAVAGSENSTLKFTTTAEDNTAGLRLANIKILRSEGSEGVEPVGNELFISEYVESFKGNNKYIEIYNPTNETIDLSEYSLKMNNNGKKEGESIVWTSLHNKTFTESIEPGKVVVFANNQAVNYEGKVVECSNMSFNGDDAVGLFKGETLIDLVGYPGIQEKFGENVVLRRVPTVTVPNVIYTLAEWSETKLTSIEEDKTIGISGLGSHTVE